MAETYYDRLGIEQDASEEEIEAAIDEAVRAIESKKRRSQKDEIEIQRLISIREVLLDPDSKDQYDDSLARGDLQADAEAADETVYFDHHSVYKGELRTGFGRGTLVSARSVDGPDLLTIKFATGTKEIIANHPGLKPVDA